MKTDLAFAGLPIVALIISSAVRISFPARSNTKMAVRLGTASIKIKGHYPLWSLFAYFLGGNVRRGL